jgi:hypothetical protein
MHVHFACALKIYFYHEDEFCVCYVTADVSRLWRVAVGLRKLSNISPFPTLRTVYLVDVEFASLFRLIGDMGVPAYVSPLETISLNC